MSDHYRRAAYELAHGDYTPDIELLAHAVLAIADGVADLTATLGADLADLEALDAVGGTDDE